MHSYIIREYHAKLNLVGYKVDIYQRNLFSEKLCT